MDFEWDEAKRLSNIRKHRGLDFYDAIALFSNPYLAAPAITIGGEQRWMATGQIDDVCVTVIYTRRGRTLRLISMRRARHEERKKYQEVFGS